MNKRSVMWIILDLVFVIIFNAIFFLVSGTEHPLPVWISYAFIHFAYLMVILTPRLIRKGKSSAVFGFSLYSVSVSYFFIELIVGVIFILALPENFKVVLVVQIVLAGVFLILLISNMIANESTAEAEEKRELEIDYVKNAGSALGALVDMVDDQGAKRKVEAAYDAIKASPVKSHPNLFGLESQIITSISALSDAVSTKDAGVITQRADALLMEINERNRQLKLLH
ncbi:MAG: hypothetical protein LBN12_08585 [Clostridiales Family XIII bacterium]|jgi:hypothetical protein|nr:hypothetical protein [Clostridiales Family XIII bacterium]